MRIAVSSSTFRRPLAAAELTQLEWLEACASRLGVDGVLADVTDFPRRDAEYVAQLRKVAIDLALVPFGIDAAGLLDPDAGGAGDAALALAGGFGAAIVRTLLPVPGDVPPAAFAAAVAAGKALGRAAKTANVTVIVAAAAGTLGDDLGSVKRLLKDVDSAWLRPCPRALDPGPGPRDRVPAFAASSTDDPRAVAERAAGGWVILDAPAPEALGPAIAALRDAAARLQLGATS